MKDKLNPRDKLNQAPTPLAVAGNVAAELIKCRTAGEMRSASASGPTGDEVIPDVASAELRWRDADSGVIVIVHITTVAGR